MAFFRRALLYLPLPLEVELRFLQNEATSRPALPPPSAVLANMADFLGSLKHNAVPAIGGMLVIILLTLFVGVSLYSSRWPAYEKVGNRTSPRPLPSPFRH